MSKKNKKKNIDDKNNNLKYCSCGEILDDDDIFCYKCGNKNPYIVPVVNNVENINDSMENKPRKSKFFIILIIIVILLLLVIGGLCYAFKDTIFGNKNENVESNEVVENNDKKIEMPNLIDLDEEKCTDTLKSLNVKYKIDYVDTYDNLLNGKVYSQSIKAGVMIDLSSDEVIVVVYKYVNEPIPSEIKMVNVVGKNKDEAVEILKKMGLKVDIVGVYNDFYVKDIVISQSIKEGSIVKSGDVVKLNVSLGNKPSTNTNNNTTNNNSTTVRSWSEWTTSLPSNVTDKNYVIEKKTEYRSRKKEVVNSEKSSLDGYTLKETKNDKVCIGNTYTTSMTESSLQSYFNSKYDIVFEYHKDGRVSLYADHCDKLGSDGKYVSISMPKSLVCPQGYESHHDTFNLVITGSYKVGDFYNNSPCTRNGTYVNNYIVRVDPYYSVKMCSAEIKVVNVFEKWSNWSSWSSNKISQSENVRVETRTLYRYKLK